MNNYKCVIFLIFLLCSFLGESNLALAQDRNLSDRQDWNSWVQDLKRDAVTEGIRSSLFDDLFADLSPDGRVMHFDKTQPERRLTFLEYRRTRIDPFRITLGALEYRKNKQILESVGEHYGVDPCFVTAFWGIETSYGHYMGNFSVVRSLATLAYDDRRSHSFRKELLIALHILNEGHVSNADFKGEWAGASGLPQFLPSSWKKYAVDYDGDGRKDIWKNRSDAFASIANYLLQHGWQKDQPWGVVVKLPWDFPTSLLGLQHTKTLEEWTRMGVKLDYGELPPDKNLKASIIEPDGGPAFMVFPNFRVLLSYNNSIFYGCSVGYLADEICKKANNHKAFGNF